MICEFELSPRNGGLNTGSVLEKDPIVPVWLHDREKIGLGSRTKRVGEKFPCRHRDASEERRIVHADKDGEKTLWREDFIRQIGAACEEILERRGVYNLHIPESIETDVDLQPQLMSSQARFFGRQTRSMRFDTSRYSSFYAPKEPSRTNGVLW
jgi:hypothetical protein